MNRAMESRKSVHKLGETIHSLIGWKSHLTTNWVKSVCAIMKNDIKPTNIETMAPIDKAANESVIDISKIEDELIILTDYINHLNTQRRHILNELLDLRGNIRVFCRIRPIGVEENCGGSRHVTSSDSNNVLLKLAENKNKTFCFDKVFHPGSTQDEVYGEVEPVIKSALDGYNACIFAYGQTGTGKSYTMEGTSNTPGVVSRAMESIFEQAVESNRVFVFSFSMLEIYLGNLKDLLAPQATKRIDPVPPCLSIKTDPKGGIEIDNLVSIRVTDFNQALKLYRQGCRFRSTASTNSNLISSRSHWCREMNKIWFIDLGGSERALKTKASGRRLDEGKAINLSLSALGDVIHALHNKNCHVPYRNSKLTLVLKDSLGEDSKTLMLVHISPKEEDLCETVCSLSFATRVRGIHLGNSESTAEKEQRESAIANLEQKMKMIEDEREGIRRNIQNLNEELERLTWKSPSTLEEQQNVERINMTETNNNEASISELPRFMKATICSSRRKSAVNYQAFEDRTKLLERKRIFRKPSSVSFPLKRRSEHNSECSISRNSCLVYLNYEKDGTKNSQSTTECDFERAIFTEQEKNISNVDSWLQFHKYKPIKSSISHKSRKNASESKHEVEIKIPAMMIEDVTPQCSFQDDEYENSEFITKEEIQCVDSTSVYDYNSDAVEKSGRYHVLVGKIQRVWTSILLALGFQNLGLEDDFFHSLTL